MAMPGVIAVVHADDLPQPVARFGVSHKDRPVIATETVNYHGEPVVAVVAETEDEARAAANAVVIHYTEVNGVYGLDAALADDARLVQDPSVRPGDDLNSTNVLEQVEYAWGDVDSEGASSHTIIEDTYTFPMVTHFPIEPGGIVPLYQPMTAVLRFTRRSSTPTCSSGRSPMCGRFHCRASGS